MCEKEEHNNQKLQGKMFVDNDVDENAKKATDDNNNWTRTWPEPALAPSQWDN